MSLNPDDIQLHCETYAETPVEKHVTDIRKLLPRGFYAGDAIMWRIDSESFLAWFDKLPTLEDDPESQEEVLVWDSPKCTLCIKMSSEIDEDATDEAAEEGAMYQHVLTYSLASFPIEIIGSLTQEQLQDIREDATCIAYHNEVQPNII